MNNTTDEAANYSSGYTGKSEEVNIMDQPENLKEYGDP